MSTDKRDDDTAIVIVCARQDGSCGRILGAVKLHFNENHDPILTMSNEGWPTDNGYPLAEAFVPADFVGSTGIIGCPAHGFLISEQSDEPPAFPGLPAGKWSVGDSVQFPFFSLKEPYREYLTTGCMQQVTWDVNRDLTYRSPRGPAWID